MYQDMDQYICCCYMHDSWDNHCSLHIQVDIQRMDHRGIPECKSRNLLHYALCKWHWNRKVKVNREFWAHQRLRRSVRKDLIKGTVKGSNIE